MCPAQSLAHKKVLNKGDFPICLRRTENSIWFCWFSLKNKTQQKRGWGVNSDRKSHPLWYLKFSQGNLVVWLESSFPTSCVGMVSAWPFCQSHLLEYQECGNTRQDWYGDFGSVKQGDMKSIKSCSSSHLREAQDWGERLQQKGEGTTLWPICLLHFAVTP